MTTETKTDRAGQHPLIAQLLRYASEDNRGALAELRRGAGEWPDCGERVLRHVARYFSETPNGPREDDLLLVATLFALQPTKSDNGRSIASALRAAAGDNVEPVERRFLRLLAADDAETLGTELRHAISFCAAKGTAPGWQRLLDDVSALLGDRDERRERVRRAWSRDFWSRDSSEKEDTDFGPAAASDDANS